MKYWHKLSLLSKIVFVIWTICSLVILFWAEPRLKITEWVVITLFGYCYYLTPAQVISLICKKIFVKIRKLQKKSSISKKESGVCIFHGEDNILQEECARPPEEQGAMKQSKTELLEKRKPVQYKNVYTSGLDDYFAVAGHFVIKEEKASIGMIQRFFKIGFNRAARIIYQLEKAGIVGEEEGNRPRRILMSAEQFEQYIEQIAYKQEINNKTDTGDESELTLQDVKNILKEKFSIDTDYSCDGELLKKLKNIIIPSENGEKQIDIINILLKFNSPRTMKLILIDDSILNYNIYNGVPQLLMPVVTNKNKKDDVVNWCCTEMQERINKFVDCEVKNIDSFNEKQIGYELPKIICIVNEANELFKHTSMPLQRLVMNCNKV